MKEYFYERQKITNWFINWSCAFYGYILITLIFIFNMEPWSGIENYELIFKPSFLYTVYPSILLAIFFIVFNVSVFYYANEDKKVWAHLAMNFGIVYSTISITNYFIQLISIMPSVMNKNINGLDIWVSGYPNSIFFALMASYFLMCLSLFFTAFVFEDKRIRFWLFLGSAGCVFMFVLEVLYIVE